MLIHDTRGAEVRFFDTIDIITIAMEDNEFSVAPQVYNGVHGIAEMTMGYTIFSTPDPSNAIYVQTSRQ